MPNFRPVERHLKFLAVDFEDHPSLRDSGAGVRQSAVQQRARPVHAAKPKEGAGAVEVVLPGAQHREAGASRICAMRAAIGRSTARVRRCQTCYCHAARVSAHWRDEQPR